MIDAVQRSLADAEKAMAKFQRCDDPEQLRDMLDSVHRELFHWRSVHDQLEVIRKHVESIRGWARSGSSTRWRCRPKRRREDARVIAATCRQ